MPSGSAGRRYAQAIFDLAREQNKVEQWAADLETLAFAFGQPQVQSFLENPKTPRDRKAQFITQMLDGRVSAEVLNLAQLLVRRERHAYVSAINQDYIRHWNQLRGIVVAQVTTAIPVDTAGQDLIRTRLVELTGQQVTVELKEDPEIIGGLVARVGDTLIDGSVLTRLQNLRKQLA
jgi:F-type H+-transporting ATPase subunit delta